MSYALSIFRLVNENNLNPSLMAIYSPFRRLPVSYNESFSQFAKNILAVTTHCQDHERYVQKKVDNGNDHGYFDG